MASTGHLCDLAPPSSDQIGLDWVRQSNMIELNQTFRQSNQMCNPTQSNYDRLTGFVADLLFSTGESGFKNIWFRRMPFPSPEPTKSIKSGKSDWLRIRSEYSAHTQKIGSDQSSRFLPQARRIVGSGDEYSPCIRRLNPQYMRQPKIRCPTETTRKQPFSSPLAKIKTMVKLLWPLLIINQRIPGLI